MVSEEVKMSQTSLNHVLTAASISRNSLKSMAGLFNYAPDSWKWPLPVVLKEGEISSSFTTSFHYDSLYLRKESRYSGRFPSICFHFDDEFSAIGI